MKNIFQWTGDFSYHNNIGNASDAHDVSPHCMLSAVLWPILLLEVNPSLAKPPLNFNGFLAKLQLTSLVK